MTGFQNIEDEAARDVIERATPASRGELVEVPEKYRAELNLEKWPQLFAPTHGKKNTGPRTYRRERELPDGSRVTSEVTVAQVGGFGTLTTEDYKTYAALIAVWEEGGRPPERLCPYSRKQLAELLGMDVGGEQFRRLKRSLLRLRTVPLFWKDAFFDKRRGEWLTIEQPFTILSNLAVIEKRRNDSRQLLLELGGFKFDERIIANLLANHSKPLLFRVVAGIRGEIALLLYRHLDNVLADKTRYERRTKELLEDLDVGGLYPYPSKRAEKLRPALEELRGKAISTGTLKRLDLARTKDGTDFKIVVEKEPASASRSPRRSILQPLDPRLEALVEDAVALTGAVDNRRSFTFLARLHGETVFDRALGECREELQLRRRDPQARPVENVAAFFTAIANRIAQDYHGADSAPLS